MKMTLSTPSTISRNVSVTRASSPSEVRNASNVITSPASTSAVPRRPCRPAGSNRSTPRGDPHCTIELEQERPSLVKPHVGERPLAGDSDLHTDPDLAPFH